MQGAPRTDLQHEPQRKLLGHSVMKRFFLSLKRERLWQRDYANHGEAQADIADYIVDFYAPSGCIPRWDTVHRLSTSSRS